MSFAAAKGSLKTVDLLKLKGAQETIVDSSDNLPVHYATFFGHIETLKRTFSDNNKNTRGYLGRTLVNIASMRGHADIVSFLIFKEADLDITNNMGMTPLMNAARMNNPAIAEV